MYYATSVSQKNRCPPFFSSSSPTWIEVIFRGVPDKSVFWCIFANHFIYCRSTQFANHIYQQKMLPCQHLPKQRKKSPRVCVCVPYIYIWKYLHPPTVWMSLLRQASWFWISIHNWALTLDIALSSSLLRGGCKQSLESSAKDGMFFRWSGEGWDVFQVKQLKSNKNAWILCIKEPQTYDNTW